MMRLIGNLLNQFKLHHLCSAKKSDVGKEKDIESLEKELSNYRQQMETKDSAYMQALRELEHSKKKTEELSVLLKISELERDRYIAECNKCENCIDELESKIKGMNQCASDSDTDDDQRGKCVEQITISIEEYNSLIRKAEKADQIPKSIEQESERLTRESGINNEVEALKKEMEVVMLKAGLFRNRAEQAATRAEAAEKAKAGLEDQLRMWKEQKQRRKAALAALREESAPKQFSTPRTEKLPAKKQPLGKVLNLKF